MILPGKIQCHKPLAELSPYESSVTLTSEFPLSALEDITSGTPRMQELRSKSSTRQSTVESPSTTIAGNIAAAKPKFGWALA
jgi:hypothetical protein